MRNILIILLLVSTQVKSETTKDDLTFKNIPVDIVEKVYDKSNVISNRPRTHRFSGWLRDEIVVSTEFGLTKQLHVIKMPLGARKQVTFESQTVSTPVTSPDGEHILFIKHDNSDNRYQLYLWSRSTNKTQKISNSSARHGYPIWSHDSKSIFYGSFQNTGKTMDIWHADISDLSNIKRKLIATPNKGHLWPIGVDSKTQYLLYKQFINSTSQHSIVFNLKTNQEVFSTKQFGDTINDPKDLSKDGSLLLFSSNKDQEFTQLYTYNLESKTSTNLSKSIPWDVRQAKFQGRSTKIVATFNEGGADALYIMNSKRNKFNKVKSLPLGQIRQLEVNQKGTKVGFTLSSMSVPANAFVYDINTQKLEHWTESESPGIIAQNVINSKIVSYPTFDRIHGVQRQIPAITYLPESIEKEPVPVIIFLHGGPEGQSKISFKGSFQKLINETGAAIIDPNYRGSKGYGKTYMALDDGMNRMDAVKDIEYLIEWIEKQPYLDSTRIALVGESYAGFLVLSLATRNPDKIKAVVTRWGISDITSFLNNVPEMRKDFRRSEYGDERTPKYQEFFSSISPMKNVDKIKASVFIAHGENDNRVHISESDTLYEVLNKKGLNPWYVRSKLEGHAGWRKDKSEILNDLITTFLKEHLAR
jgi:dipeptidyl aminopeptidase/acylaminoacyl peptidase